MTPITLIDNEFATLVLYPEKKTVHHCFHQATSGNALKEILTRGTEAFEQYGASKWLSDDRHNMAIPPEDVKWGHEVWFPRTKKAGWKTWALIVPEDFMARASMVEFVQTWAGQGVNVRLFTDVDLAVDWLDAN